MVVGDATCTQLNLANPFPIHHGGMVLQWTFQVQLKVFGWDDSCLDDISVNMFWDEFIACHIKSLAE